MSCVTVKYVSTDINCLPNNPKWELHFEQSHLKGVMLRVDSFSYVGGMNDNLGNNFIHFERYALFLKMNTKLPGPPVFNPNRKPSYRKEDIQINLSVSDTLDVEFIENIKKEDSNKSIEKGYIGRNAFIYINNYDNTDEYVLINLNSRVAYKLEQDKDNLKHTNRGLNAFVENGCYQGIVFLAKGGNYSIGDCTMY
jgi:hypothetical protein